MANEMDLEVTRPGVVARPGYGTMAEMMEFAKVLAQSSLVPKDFQGKPGNCLIAMQLGTELGFPWAVALQNVAVINGRPCIYGDLGKALLRSKGFDILEEVSVDGAIAVCTVTHPRQKPVTRTFSISNAQKAGLWGKQGPWSQYPERMLSWRAFWFAARDAAADVLKGVRGTEEVQDYPASEGPDFTPFMEPRRLSEAIPAAAPAPVPPAHAASASTEPEPAVADFPSNQPVAAAVEKDGASSAPSPSVPVTPSPATSSHREPGDEPEETSEGAEVRCDCSGHPIAIFRSGVGKNGRPWSAWMCAKPKNDDGNCKFVSWVR